MTPPKLLSQCLPPTAAAVNRSYVRQQNAKRGRSRKTWGCWLKLPSGFEPSPSNAQTRILCETPQLLVILQIEIALTTFAYVLLTSTHAIWPAH